jgi:tRNA pseudouridine38-40 synthase
MFRYFVRLSYLGTNYCGWQIQPNSSTIQQIINQAFTLILKENIEVTGCGRTDTGVHAQNFIAHFDSKENFILDELKQLIFALNRFLPPDISIHEIFEVNETSHARFDAISRTYIYKITTTKNPFLFSTSWYRYGDLDIEKMNKASNKMIEFKDFSCFSKSKTQVKTNNCEIKESFWIKNDNGLYEFKITADRFLRNMVRAIVGTMIEIGSGKLKWEEIENIIKSQNRSQAGFSVPAKGLTFCDIKYPESIYKLTI